MRLLNIVIICVVGVVCAYLGYWLATPHAPAGTTDQAIVHNGHGHESENSSVTLAPEKSESDWCAEHWVPESECTLCNPSLIAAFQASGDWCAEHTLPESHCRRCNPKLTFAQEPKSEPQPVQEHASSVSVFYPSNETGCTNDQALIQFASEETAARTGILAQPVVESYAASTVEAPAEIVFDETRVKALSTTVTASGIRWLVNPGQRA